MTFKKLKYRLKCVWSALTIGWNPIWQRMNSDLEYCKMMNVGLRQNLMYDLDAMDDMRREIADLKLKLRNLSENK